MKNFTKRNTIIFLIFCLIIIIPILSFNSCKIETKTNLPDYGDVHKFDPNREGGHLLPNLNTLIKGEKVGQHVRIITNKKGFRNDREFNHNVPHKTYRILLLGDSYVDGMRTDQKNTIGYVLEKLLNASIKGENSSSYEFFEVMISGHNNPANAWYYYQEHGYKYHPNLVILGITLGNDITWHNYKSELLPVTSDDGTLYLKLVPNARRQIGTQKRDLLLPPDAYESKSRFWEKIQDRELLTRMYLARKSNLFGYSIPPQLGPDRNTKRHVYAAGFFNSLGLFYRPTMPEIEEMYLDFEEVLSGINNRVKADDSELLLVLFPIRAQVSKKDLDLLTRFYSLRKTKFDLNYPNHRITMFCKEQNINCLDLLLPFKQYVEETKGHLYRSRGDMHFNEMGQRLAGRMISETINSN